MRIAVIFRIVFSLFPTVSDGLKGRLKMQSGEAGIAGFTVYSPRA